MSYVTVATCALDQFAMDFNLNLRNIVDSIRIAKIKNARIRIGPELEVSGYSCEDHFLESDTIQHCWDSIHEILKDPDLTMNILCDIGMPVLHQGVRYNCRILILNQKIVMIRPKMWLAEDGNYREGRWFAPWSRGFVMEDFILPRKIRLATGGQVKCPFGVGIVRLGDTAYAVETCEELFTANNPGISLGLAGVEIIGNGSGSHHSMSKRRRRFELIEETTKKNGGVYLYANQIGCDGTRLLFDGCAMVACNGSVISFGSQFTIRDVEVITATVDLRDVRSYRASVPSRGRQAAIVDAIPCVDVPDFFIAMDLDSHTLKRQGGLSTDTKRDIQHHSPEEEMAFGPACWMWDYLRRSGLNGFFLPLSGGADSAATAALVGIMCQLLYEEIQCELPRTSNVLIELRKVLKNETYTPSSWKDICGKLFYCCYMGTKNNSQDTLDRARNLAENIGANFDVMRIDEVCTAFEGAWGQISQGRVPAITSPNPTENLALQNIQARSRMVLSYMCAQLMLWRDHANRKWPGSLLVLGSANLDEALRGYFTKYDCSSADINPIGSWSKVMIKQFLRYAAVERDMPAIIAIVESHSSAELQPTTADGKQAQVSEEEMGMSFEELEVYGRLRNDLRCGPVSMYQRLLTLWPHLTPTEIATKVKTFFKFYAQNRHKTTILPPAYHMSTQSNDDNRFDLRQIIYNTTWPRQFEAIDEYVRRDERAQLAPQSPTQAHAPNFSEFSRKRDRNGDAITPGSGTPRSTAMFGPKA